MLLSSAHDGQAAFSQASRRLTVGTQASRKNRSGKPAPFAVGVADLNVLQELAVPLAYLLSAELLVRVKEGRRYPGTRQGAAPRVFVFVNAADATGQVSVGLHLSARACAFGQHIQSKGMIRAVVAHRSTMQRLGRIEDTCKITRKWENRPPMIRRA